MPLQKQNVDIIFDKGIDRTLDPKLVIPSKFTRLENLEFSSNNTVRQRPGYSKATLAAVGTGTVPSNIRRLMSYGSEVLLESDTGIHAYAQANVVSRNDVQGTYGLLNYSKPVERAQVDYNNIASSALDQWDVDACIATQSRLECWAWTEEISGASGVYYKVIDSVTRAIVQQGSVAIQGGVTYINPRVIERYVSGGTSTFYIYYASKIISTDVTSLMVRSIAIANNSKAPGALSIEVDALGGGQKISKFGVFDCVYDLTNDRVCMAYIGPGTNYYTHLRTISAADGFTSVEDYATALTSGPGSPMLSTISVSIATGAGPFNYMVASFAVGSAIYAVSGKISNLVATIQSINVGSATTPGLITSMTSPFDSGKVLIFFDYTGSYTTPTDTFPYDIGFIEVDYTATLVTAISIFARGVSLAARPVAYYSTAGTVDVCVFTCVRSDLQPTIFAMKFGGSAYAASGFPALASHTTPRVLGRIFPGECGTVRSTSLGGNYTNHSRLPTCLGGYSTAIHLPFTKQGMFHTEGGAGATVVNITKRECSKAVFNFSLALPALEAQRSLFMSGACPMLYDGTLIHEAGFHIFPEGVTGTSLGSTGFLNDSGAGPGTGTMTYQGIFVYEWKDSQGVLHRSAPSPSVSVTMVVTDRHIDWTVPYLRLTDKRDVQLVLYRTEGNRTIFYRDVSTAVSNSLGASAALTVTSSVADSTLRYGEQLYSSGAANQPLTNDPFPSTSIICLHQNRIFMAMQEETGWIQFTDEIDERFLAPATSTLGFDAIMRLRVPPEAGKVVGLASMDEKLIVICENMVGYYFGQGPDRNGAQNTYSPFEKCLPTLGGLAGCQESITLNPDGLWFMSASNGMILLTRGLTTAMQPSDPDSYFGNESAADFTDSVFSSIKAVTIPTRNQIRWYLGGGSIYLAYDYEQHQWAKGTAHNSNGGSCVARGLFWHSDGTDLFSSRTTAGGFDSTATITPMVLETAWLNMAGLQGFQRVYQLMLLAQGVSTSTIGIEVGYDYATTYATSIPYAQTGAVDPLQIEFALPRQKCNAVRFRITITPGASGAEAIRLTAFSLSVGIKGGLNRLATAKRI